jgi:hypothetical protein
MVIFTQQMQKTSAIGFRHLVFIVREGNPQSVAGFHLGYLCPLTPVLSPATEAVAQSIKWGAGREGILSES